MNNSILDIENTFTTGDHLAYLMTEAKDDSSYYTRNINGLFSDAWMYQSLGRENLNKIFSHAPEGFIEFLADNDYIYLSKFSKSYLLKSKLRKIISVNS
jgi:hypothetical protein